MAKTEKSTSYMMDVVRRFRKHKLAMISLCVLIVEVLLVIFLPIVLNLDPYTTDYSTYFGAPPSAQHWLGTDDVGRDSFARFIAGGRVSLSVGIISAIISLVIGVPLGLIAGYYRGWIETLIMRLSDVFMSFPSMVLILVLVAPVLIAFTFRAAQAIITESALSFLGMGVQAPQASWGNILYEAQSISVLATRPWLWVPPGIALLVTILCINFLGDGIRDALDTKMVI